jgi:chitinase
MLKFFLLLLAASHSLARSIAIPAELLTRGIEPIDAMIADNTCEWSNCGEPCNVGFVAVPRTGGERGEMMQDATLCGDHGLSLFCCPSNAPQPTCRWRGHHNTGKCTGGCHRGEAEVWTINAGCNSGYQSACCTTTTTGIEAYDYCRWEGTAPKCWASFVGPERICSAEYPTRAISSPAGFGGERMCSQGTWTQVILSDSQGRKMVAHED